MRVVRVELGRVGPGSDPWLRKQPWGHVHGPSGVPPLPNVRHVVRGWPEVPQMQEHRTARLSQRQQQKQQEHQQQQLSRKQPVKPQQKQVLIEISEY